MELSLEKLLRQIENRVKQGQYKVFLLRFKLFYESYT